MVELVDAQQAAVVLGVRRETVYELVRTGGLPHKRLGRGPRARLRFDPEEILAWTASCASAGDAPPLPDGIGSLLTPRHL